MFKLVRKDLRMTRIFWLPAIFSYWVFLLTFHEYAWAELFIGITLTAAMAGSFLYIDEMSRTDPLFGALPLSRRDIVWGRYLTTAVIVGISLILFFGGTASIRTILGDMAANLDGLLTVRAGLAIAASVFFLMSLFFPMYFKLGLGKASIRLVILLLGTLIVLSGLAQLFSIRIPGAPPEGDESAPGIFLSIPMLLQALARRAEAALGEPLLALLTVALCASVVYLSLCLSVRFFSQRDL